MSERQLRFWPVAGEAEAGAAEMQLAEELPGLRCLQNVVVRSQLTKIPEEPTKGNAMCVRMLAFVLVTVSSSNLFSQVATTLSNTKTAPAFDRALKAEAMAAEHPQDDGLCMKLEEALNDLIDHVLDDEIFTPGKIELSAKNIVARTSVCSPPRMITSFAPVLPWVFPENTPRRKVDRPEYSAEHFSKFIVYRCLTDRQFEDQYIHMLLWSGRFIRSAKSSNQRYETALLMSHLRSPESMGEGVFWGSLHQLFVLTRLFGFNEDEAFPSTQAEAKAWADDLAEWALAQKFKLGPNGLCWQSAGARDSTEPGIDLVPIHLPKTPMPAVFDWPFESIRRWGGQN